MSARGPTPPLRPLPDPARQRATGLRLLAVFLFYFVALFQFIFAMRWNLAPDEAFYWLLSRHLRMGYLDHPPGIAWIIRLTTSIIGSSEAGVRAGMIVMSLCSIAILLKICRSLLADVRAYWLLLAIGLSSPLLCGLGLIATPDTPAMFFSMAALAMAVMIARRLEPAEAPVISRKKSAPQLSPALLPWWLALGLFCGLALLSKYTAILLPASIVVALLTSPTGRQELAKPGLYLSALVALLVFLPNLIWNGQHDWISFKYQWHHGLSSSGADVRTPMQVLLRHLRDFGEYLGGQVLIWTPVLFALGAVAFIATARQFRTLTLAWRMLLWAAIFPLVFFGLTSLHSRGEPNWPAFAYLPLSLLTVAWAVKNYSGPRGGWIRIGIIVALVTNVMLHAPDLIFKAQQFAASVTHAKNAPELPKKLSDFFGWRQFGQTLGSISDQGHIPVICATHEEAGEASFYIPNQPDVWCLSLGPDSRPTAFDSLDESPPWKDAPAVVIVNFGSNKKEFFAQFGYQEYAEESWQMRVFNHLRNRTMILCEKKSELPAAAGPATVSVPATRPEGP